tara:strand:+ start:401 stop:2353 length:1953 start_codon:yes stop_codon:yes gene_type:complete
MSLAVDLKSVFPNRGNVSPPRTIMPVAPAAIKTNRAGQRIDPLTGQPLYQRQEVVSLNNAFDEPSPFAVDSFLPESVEPVAAQPITQKQAAANSQALADKQKAEGSWEVGLGYGGLPSQSDITFDSGDVYDTTDKALGGFASFIGNLESQRRDTNNKYGLTRFDPSDYMRAGLSGPRDLGNTAARDALTSYVKDNNMPLTQVRDGVTYHLTGGSETFNHMLHGRKRDGIWQDQGPVGTYSTVYVDTSQSMFQEILNNPVLRVFGAIATGGVSEGVISAGRGLAGETLHASDWLSIGTAGLTMSGAIAPPVDAAAAEAAGTAAMQAADAAGATSAAAMATGTAAQTAAAAGKGLTIAGKTLSYNQSMGLLTAAATGDPKQAIGQIFGADLVKGGLGKIGVTVDTVGDVQYNAVSQGLNTVVNKVAAGEDLDKALASGLVTYVKEDGTRGSIDLGGSLGLDVSGLKKVVEDLVRPIGAMATDFAHFVEDAVPDTRKAVEAIKEAGSEFDDAVLQPTKGLVEEGASVAGDVLSAADTAARDAASAFDDAVIQPTGQALSDLDTAIRQALPDINGPDIDLPSFDLNIPNFNPAFGTTQLNYSAPSSTRTTDSLFKDELFQFQTEIGVDLEPTEYVDLGFSDPFQDQTLLQRYPF